jgi:hypothetical protein
MAGGNQRSEQVAKHGVDVFLEQMREMNGKSVDLSHWSFYWAFDVTFEWAFGNRFGYMETKSDLNGMIGSFKTAVRGAAMIGQIPQWCPWTLESAAFMNFFQRLQGFKDPTQILIQV